MKMYAHKPSNQAAWVFTPGVATILQINSLYYNICILRQKEPDEWKQISHRSLKKVKD